MSADEKRERVAREKGERQGGKTGEIRKNGRKEIKVRRGEVGRVRERERKR